MCFQLLIIYGYEYLNLDKMFMNFFIAASFRFIQELENSQLKSNFASVNVGDVLKIGTTIQEGDKERIQFSKGIVISKSNAGLSTTITLRRILQGIGVEKIYLIHSPKILSVEVIKKSKVRRAKLYYLRNRYGKSTRLKQRLE